MENKDQYVLSKKVVNDLLNYLAGRPFGEVVMIVSQLSSEINAQKDQPKKD